MYMSWYWGGRGRASRRLRPPPPPPRFPGMASDGADRTIGPLSPDSPAWAE